MGRLLDRVLARQVDGFVGMPVAEHRPAGDVAAEPFRPNEVYLEIRIEQM